MEIIIATIMIILVIVSLIVLGIHEELWEIAEFQITLFLIVIIGAGFLPFAIKEEIETERKLEVLKQHKKAVICDNKLIEDFLIIDKKIIDKETNYVYRINNCEVLNLKM